MKNEGKFDIWVDKKNIFERGNKDDVEKDLQWNDLYFFLNFHNKILHLFLRSSSSSTNIIQLTMSVRMNIKWKLCPEKFLRKHRNLWAYKDRG